MPRKSHLKMSPRREFNAAVRRLKREQTRALDHVLDIISAEARLRKISRVAILQASIEITKRGKLIENKRILKIIEDYEENVHRAGFVAIWENKRWYLGGGHTRRG